MWNTDTWKEVKPKPKVNQDTSIQVVLQNQPFRVGAEKKQNLHPMNDRSTNQPVNFPLIQIAVTRRTDAQINSKSDLHSESAGSEFRTRKEVRGSRLQANARFVIKVGRICSFQIHRP
jgi:hypothetical protein